MSTALPKPKSKIAKVLYALATGQIISEQDFRINSFRSILSDLRRRGVNIRSAKEVTKDEFGKQIWYFRYFTLKIDRKKCEKVYKSINQ